MTSNHSGITRRQFLAGMAALTATAAIGRPGRVYADTSRKIVLIHTNDVHCKDEPNPLEYSSSQTNMGYAGVGTLLSQAEEESGTSNVLLVDSGDFAQGGSTGLLTDGEGLVTLMNATGYSYATLGNHDFDYGLDRLKELVSMADFKFVCCNLTDTATGLPWADLDPYLIKEIGGKKIAFLGIVTPETLTKSNPNNFTDENGNYLVSFAQDSTGEALYACVQKYVDQVRNVDGADYVVALSHLGQKGITQRWTSTAVCANTTGIDIFLDGHSHEKYVQTDVKNAAGDPVTIVQTGTQLVAASKIVIDTGTDGISAELITPPVEPDAAVAASVETVEDALAPTKSQVVGTSNYTLYAYEDDGSTWAVRRHETNLGDFVADAYRVRTGAQIGLIEGGGLRANLNSGTVTYGDLINVNPFGDEMAVVSATGQNIADALEMGAMNYPGNSGAFFQVSGMTYEIRTDIATSVTTDEGGNFTGVSGARRVQNIKVAGAPLDLAQEYTVAGNTYFLCEAGDGLTMWQDATPIPTESVTDAETLRAYLASDCSGVIGADYENENGQGRIVFKDGPDADDDGAASGSGTANAASSTKAAATGDEGGFIASAAAIGAAASAGIVLRIAKSEQR